MKERNTLIIIAAATVLAAVGIANWLPAHQATTMETPAVSTPVEPVSKPLALVELPAPDTAFAKPVGNATVGDTVSMTGRLSHPYLATGSGVGRMTMQIDVDGADSVARVSAPLDVVLVIDRSGSMRGDKLTDAKRAAREFVGRLRTNDRVGLVTYSTDATREVPLVSAGDATSRRFLIEQIDNIMASGSTNIERGMAEARQVLQNGGRSKRVRRVVLLSDGRATAGARDAKTLAAMASSARQSGVSITTMGLGADYDERTMTGIAKRGGGNYYFLADAAALAPAFTSEFKTLLASIARNTAVEIKLAAGTRFRKLHGFDYSESAGTVTVPLADFWAKRNASMMVELDVDRPGAVSNPKDVATLTLRYDDLVHDRPADHRATLSVSGTGDKSLVARNLDGEVLVRAEQVATTTAYDNAMDEFEAGNVEEARQVLQKRKKQLEVRRRDLSATGLFSGRKGRAMLGALADESAAAEKDAKVVARTAPSARAGKMLMKRSRKKSYDSMRVNAFK